MKKTLTVNLGGTVFQIDEDAYILLDNYLNNLRFHFRNEEGEEIVSDMEMRISELFIEFMEGGQQVITIDNVEAVIVRMGKPEELDDEGLGGSSDESGRQTENGSRASGGFQSGAGEERRGTYETAQEHAWNASEHGHEHIKKRLYRDVDNRVLGGVLAGIAAYCGCDRTALRLLLIIVCLLPYLSIGLPMLIIYFILQFIIPPARTATEKLQMRGEPVNMENIGKTVTDGFEREKSAGDENVKRTGLHKFLDVVVIIFVILIKVFIAILIVCCIPIFFGLLISLFAIIMSALGIIIHFPSFCNFMYDLPWHSFMCSNGSGLVALISALLVIGIPFIGLFHVIFQRVDHIQPMRTSWKITLLVIWLVAILVGVISFF